ncbi:hypothetical protein [uncultured Sphingobacterium sp.]|uniref:hypothetical protein n=1 Tax=uncultured Sphingobacterium sp. TaxID=182688 RepID=UPI0025ED16E8|nr:hypothetical protein [uncultured Sphingobacterium sp.]
MNYLLLFEYPREPLEIDLHIFDTLTGVFLIKYQNIAKSLKGERTVIYLNYFGVFKFIFDSL